MRSCTGLVKQTAAAESRKMREANIRCLLGSPERQVGQRFLHVRRSLPYSRRANFNVSQHVNRSHEVIATTVF